MNSPTKSLSCILLLLLCSCSSVKTEKQTEWKLIWSDEFNQNGFPSKSSWSYATGGHGWGNKELQYYTDSRPENAYVKNGLLHITTIKESYKGNEYTSARLITKGKRDMQYGRLEIRAKLPDGRGTWPAIWMMPSDWSFEDGGWPDIGEIDIMEHVGHDPEIVHASAHSKDYQWQKGSQKTGTIHVPGATEEFHIYTLDWTEKVLRAYVDGQMYFEYFNEGLGSDKWPYNKPFYLILNLAVGGEWGSVKGIDEQAFPQEMLVDYVRFYKAQ